MDQEEKYIEEKFGRRTPFKVPEGYFDSFASQLIQNLPEREPAKKAKVVELRPSAWHRYCVAGVAAACVGGALLTVGTYLNGSDGQQAGARAGMAAGQDQGRQAYSSVDAMADYTMMDTEDMYALMADADN